MFKMAKSRSVVCFFLLLSFGNLLVVSSQETEECASNNPPSDFFLSPPEEPNYLIQGSGGRQVIAPRMNFSCHGRITNWTALTLFNPKYNILGHRISFQVWRPSTEVDGKYTLVGSNALLFPSPQGSLLENSTTLAYFPLSETGVDEGDQIKFQPRDCLGWFIQEFSRQIANPPLRPVFLNSTNNFSGMAGVDLFSMNTSKQLCEMYTCSDSVSLHQSTVPYVRPSYVLLSAMDSDDTPDIMCMSNLAVPSSCIVNTPTSFQTTPTTLTPLTPADSEFVYIVSGVVCGTSAILLTAAVWIICICVCCKCWKKFTKSEYAANPTYASPDDFIRLDQPLGKEQQEHTQNGVVLVSSENNVVKGFPNIQTRNDLYGGDYFDGQNYASTYQTNGKCHMYHELSCTPTTTVPPPLPRRLSSTSFKAKSNSMPRFSIQSISQFPYILPVTPATSCPYLEAVPVATSSHRQPRTPQDSPPSSASAQSSGELTMRKLFHALDEEGFHVPTAAERDLIKNSSAEDLYSKLNRPHSDLKSRQSRDHTFFEPSEIFWEPSYSSSELFNQLAQRKYREIKRTHIRVIATLGGGNFSTVHKGVWEVPGGNIDVAVKTLKPQSSEDDKVKFLQEAAIMGQFIHPNVAKLQGVVTLGEPGMIVLELMPKGDLKNYLRSLRTLPKNTDLPKLFLRFCREIAFGMNYLSNKGYVHRDLAARNILLTDDLTCKIGDFGMARDLDVDNIYQSQGGKIPLKWTAPEGLRHRQYSTASDVWSYGMLLFEVWTLGRKPYEGTSVDELMNLMNLFHCQPPPPGCPREVYRLMVQCWHPVPAERLCFNEISTYLNSTDEVLLNWSNSDRSVGPRVTELGERLSEGVDLYLDLQFMYSPQQSDANTNGRCITTV